MSGKTTPQSTAKAAAKLNFKVIGKTAVAAIFFAAIFYAGFTAITSPFFQVSDLTIELADEASQGMLFNKIKDTLDTRLRYLRGRYVWQVDIEEVLNKVQKDLRVKDAKVTRVLPNRILVSVTPFTPIASILTKTSDKLQPVARDGELLPALDATETPDGPILRGEIFVTDKNVRAEAIKLMLALPENGSLSISQISEIQYDKSHGFTLTATPGGTDVWIGFEDFTRHASQAQRVLDYLRSQQLTGRIIDARLGKKVVVRLRNAP